MWVGILEGDGTLECVAAKQMDTSPDPDTWAENIAHSGSSTNPKTQANNSWYKKLRIKFTGISGKCNITVCLIPLENGQNAPESIPDVKALSEWK